MQVSVEATGSLERRMEVQVPAARIEKAIEDRLQSMSRTVRLKGFRPGKVPVKIVRQQFGQQVRSEVIGDLMQQSFSEAIGQQKLIPASGPRIEPIDFAQGQDLKYRAVFEILPEVKLNGVEGLAVNKPAVEVTVGDIDAMIENLRKQRPNFVAVEREARDTDQVTADFEGTLDGVPFDGGKGENVPVALGSGRMLPDFEAGLKGMRAGEQKTIDVKFPDNYQAQNLAGKTAKFALAVKKVEEQELPEVNDEFCTHYGVVEGGVTQLRKEVEENMRQELAQTVRARLKKQILDGLLAANPLDVPSVLVAEQVQNMQLEMGRRMGVREAAQLPAAEQFKDGARQRVALGLVINEVIKTAQLTLDKAKVQAKVAEMAEQYPDADQVHRAYRENAQLRGQIESAVLEDQVIDWLLERAKIAEQPATFKEVMNFGA
ncbi:MAG: trigger factor [Candidatus Obscuribacterales bacterium]|nr:trigger factor [Steroidobacteraceae bacterium]